MGAVASAGAAGLQALSTIQTGKGTKAADEYQADRLERQAEIARTDAAETGAQMTENLTTTLGNIDAIRAAAGADPSSPTTAALRDRTSFIANRAESIKVDNFLMQANMDNSDASYLREAGSYALKTSYLGAAGQALGALSKISLPGGGGGGGPVYPPNDI